PDRDRDRTDTAALAAEIDDDPPPLPELNSFDVQGGKFLPAQSAADQESNDDIIAFALEGRAIRHREQFLRLFTSKPVAQPSSLLPHIGDVAEIGSFFES